MTDNCCALDCRLQCVYCGNDNVAAESRGRSGPVYRAIADAIDEDVQNGALRAGARLPPHRDLADHLGVTVTTITRAYTEAARRGLTSGHVGRGTFIRGQRAGGRHERPRSTSASTS